MRLLSVSAGPNPDTAHSNSYLDALPPALAAIGNEVAELHMAGIGPWGHPLCVAAISGPLRRWTMVNSAAYAGLPPGAGNGSARPLGDARPSRRLRAAVLSVVKEFRPEVVHLQNLFGFPVELARELRTAGIPVVFTAHDYFSICPTAHLFTPEVQPCDLTRNDLTCSHCCAGSQSYGVFRCVHWLNSRLSSLQPANWRWKVLARIRNGLVKANRTIRQRVISDGPYRDRFDLMSAALHDFDLVHCISQMQAHRMQVAVGTLARLRILPLVPPDVARLTPIARNPNDLLRIAVLNVLPGRDAKGWTYLHRVLASFEQEPHVFQIDWYADGNDAGRIRYHGRYEKTDLDRIAAESDFCLIPSVWPETLGFVGVEMLSRGVPIICSNRCGVAEWITHGRTGFVFDPANPSALQSVLQGIINAPQRASQMRAAQAAACASLMTFGDHVLAMSALLEDVRSVGGGA